MNVFIIHGLAKTAISKKISEIKKDFDPLLILEVKGRSAKEILTEILTPGLFSGKRLFLIEDLDEDLNLENLPEDENLHIVLKFSKTLNPKSLFLNLKRKNVKIFNFAEEKETSIFPFLDAVIMKNPKALDLLNKLYREYGSQYILTMLFYSLRRFVCFKNLKNEFARKKIENLKENFPKKKLKDLYHEILKTDYKIKLGILEEGMAVEGLVLKMINS